jgi:DNA-binding GntR family transcriptional regulator
MRTPTSTQHTTKGDAPTDAAHGLAFMSKAELVTAAVRELIIRGELAPGASLRQRDLAERFEVSATPVREALKQLEAEGLVTSLLHRGAVVVESNRGAMEDNYRIRAVLEALAATMATARMPAEAISELDRINDEIARRKDDDDAVSDLNRQLHFQIYEHTGSPVLLSLMRLLWQSFARGPQIIRPVEDSIREHRELIAALRERDGQKAGEVTKRHILGAIEYWRKVHDAETLG